MTTSDDNLELIGTVADFSDDPINVYIDTEDESLYIETFDSDTASTTWVTLDDEMALSLVLNILNGIKSLSEF